MLNLETFKNMLNFETFKFSNNPEKMHWIKVYTTITIKLVLSLIAVYLAWDCNKNSSIVLRIIVSIIALVFSEIYILYYAIYRVFMGNKCY